MKIALRFVEGTLTGQVKEAFLYDKKHVMIGRDSTANIVLPESDRSASSTHAKLVFEKGEVYINDVGSHYGTFVNHKPATRSKIKHGDFIRFGVKGPLAEFLIVPDGQTMATPVQKPAAPVERNAQSPTGAPIQKRGRPAATRIMQAPSPEMLAMLAGDVAGSVAAAAGVPQAPPPLPPQMPQMPPAFPPPMPVPPGGMGAPVVVLGGRPGAAPPPMPMPMPVPMPIPRPQQVPPPAAPVMPEPPSQRGAAKKTQVGMGAMMNPAMRRRLEQQGKLPQEGEVVGEGTADGMPEFADAPQGEAGGWPQPAPPPGGPSAPVFVLGGGGPAPFPPPMPIPAPVPVPAPMPIPAPAPAPAADDTKECPFCAERIKKQAIKCRFCGEYLTTTPPKANDPDAPPALDDRLYAMPKDARGPAIAPPPAPPPPPAPAPMPPPRKPDMQIQKTEMFQAPAEEPAAPPPDEAPHWELPPLDDEGKA